MTSILPVFSMGRVTVTEPASWQPFKTTIDGQTAGVEVGQAAMPEVPERVVVVAKILIAEGRYPQTAPA